MKKYAIICVLPVLVCLFLLCGCSKTIYPDLPENPTAFEMGSFTYDNLEGMSFGTIEYNGRTYIAYGTLGGTLHREDIDECIGYIICDENSSGNTDLSDTDRHVYTLADDENCDFLMDYYVSANLMNQPSFWRAADTMGKDIEHPDFIYGDDYEMFWK